MSSVDRGAVELRGVSKRFGTHVAVQPLDLAIRGGEFVALLGSSGCGKTTTLRMVGGFETPDTGQVVIGGTDVTHTPAHRRPVNTVFQHYALFPHMNVADNVAYGLRRRGLPRDEVAQRVSTMLEQVEMQSLAARWPEALSGGQQQRVALARALVNEPHVLLLDEPLGALDRQLRQQMQIELKHVQRRLGITFLYVTHDQEEALGMADRVAVMHEGRLEQVASPQVIYDEPASAFVAGFVGQQNFFVGRRVDARTVRLEGHELVTARAPWAVTETVVAAVRPEAIGLSSTPPTVPTNAMRAVVEDVLPLGDTLQYVMGAGDHEILVRQPRAGGAPIAVGEVRWCTWPAEAVRLFSGPEAVRAAAEHRRRDWSDVR